MQDAIDSISVVISLILVPIANYIGVLVNQSSRVHTNLRIGTVAHTNCTWASAHTAIFDVRQVVGSNAVSLVVMRLISEPQIRSAKYSCTRLHCCCHAMARERDRLDKRKTHALLRNGGMTIEPLATSTAVPPKWSECTTCVSERSVPDCASISILLSRPISTPCVISNVIDD
jgi:hypothetical protein